MRIVTASQMRSIDEQTIEAIGIPGIVLMENASRAVVRFICSNFPDASRIAILVGKGNNGGDGLVIARLPFQAGSDVTAFLLEKKVDLKNDVQMPG